MFGRHGQGEGELDRPISIAVDTNDRVYVSEGSNHRISIFVSKGQFVTSFGGRGEKPGEFCSPCGLTRDSSGVFMCATTAFNCYDNCLVMLIERRDYTCMEALVPRPSSPLPGGIDRYYIY